MKTAIGANCLVHYTSPSGLPPLDYYISFGTWKDDDETDSFGVVDDKIAFYCEGGEDELKRLCAKDNGEDFWVESYEIEWSLL